MDFNSLLHIIGDELLFDSSVLLAGNVDPKLIRVQLSRWVKAGKILQLRRGLYTFAPPYQKRQPHPFLVANHLQKSSYVSLQSALSFYGLIPDIVNITTSVSTGRPGLLETPLGRFEFRHVKTELFFSYQMIDLGDQNAFLASPEKALLDLIYLQSGSDSMEYLKELRLQNLEKLDREILRKLADKFNTQKLKIAAGEIIQLMDSRSEEYEDI